MKSEEDLLVRKHLALVYHAKDVLYRRYATITDRDSVESGVMQGLLKAIRKYDPDRGMFSTLAFKVMTRQVIDVAVRPGLRHLRATDGQCSSLVDILHTEQNEEVELPQWAQQIIHRQTWAVRILMRLVYWEGLNPSEAGRAMGYSRSWGATMHKVVLDKLKRYAKIIAARSPVDCEEVVA